MVLKLFLLFQGLTNTFQVILVTDGVGSYAIFIYKCGGMEWGSGVIGWQTSSSIMSHITSVERLRATRSGVSIQMITVPLSIEYVCAS